MGVVLTTVPPAAAASFCRMHAIPAHTSVPLALGFDLKTTGHLRHSGTTVVLSAPLTTVVHIARLVRQTTGCKAVEFAWPEGAGVVVGERTLVTTLPPEGYHAMSRRAACQSLLDEGLSQEDAEALLDDEGGAYDHAPEFRDALQHAWQALAVRLGRYPSKRQLGRQAPFATLFSLGYDTEHYGAADLAVIDQAIDQMRGNGPSYTDLAKARAFLAWTPGEPRREHRDRIRLFFENAPRQFLDRVRHFEALIPATGGWVVAYASARVRGSVSVGRLAASKINGWDSGYPHLEEPARSDREVLCTMLAQDPQGLQQAPAEVQRALKSFLRLLPAGGSPRRPVTTDGRAVRKALANERFDEAIAWSVGQLRGGGMSAADLVALHGLIQGHRIRG
ncbi:hypothetical protein ACT80S_15665 [Ramlibacter sp. MAHUQ-53]|uniref:hypothetical protein n=1 Tax=unclassified Ramlibacter TaxID=2617605 RepID=UPI003642F357